MGTKKAKKAKKAGAQRDIDYLAGRRAAYRSLLGECARALGFKAQANDPEAMVARLLAERLDLVTKLRRLCEAHGDNEWESNAYLPDVMERHLGDLGRDL